MGEKTARNKGREGKNPHSGHTHLNPTAIICDLKKLQSTVLDENIQSRGTSINGILYQLLESMYRGDNNFTCCNLVDYIWVQGLF